MFKIAKSISCTLVLILIFIAVGMVFAADREAIPIPANTEEIKQETRSIAGSKFDYIQYETGLNPDQVRNFYRRALDDAGWKENNYLNILKQNPGANIDAAAIKGLEQNLSFEKDGAMLNITFAPDKTGKKTGYTLMQGKLELAGKNAEEIDFLPRLLNKPKQEPAPVYPDAALISLSEGASFMHAAYTSKDDMGTVAKFYRQGMPGYGWDLAEDNPERNLETAVSEEDVAKYCPECAKKGAAMPQSNMVLKELIFTNARQDKCRIGLFEVYVPAQGPAQAMTFTNIMVDYEKK